VEKLSSPSIAIACPARPAVHSTFAVKIHAVPARSLRASPS